MRPQTLLMVSESVLCGAPFHLTLKMFLDDLEKRNLTREQRFADEPLFIEDDTQRVFMAGLAEHLSRSAQMAPPDWTEKACYFLEKPILLGGNRSQQQFFMETPSSFRRRLLFCGKI